MCINPKYPCGICNKNIDKYHRALKRPTVIINFIYKCYKYFQRDEDNDQKCV